jgi:thioredoxin-dependent peroxiredoxin
MKPSSRRFAACAALCLPLVLAAVSAHAAAPAVGAAASAFRLQDQAAAWHTLDEYRGRWLVLYFYPKDETPGCTTQACELRDDIFAFRKLGASIVGISVDDVASHKEFAARHSLPFTILADTSKQTARDYGVLVKWMGVMELAQRDTFIIDPQGRIAAHWAKVEPKGHSQLVLKELTALIRPPAARRTLQRAQLQSRLVARQPPPGQPVQARPRTTWPLDIPVGSPPASARLPLTITSLTPVANWCGRS